MPHSAMVAGKLVLECNWYLHACPCGSQPDWRIDLDALNA